MVGFGPYVLLQTLGEGEFGKVKLGVHTEFGVEVAIKLIRRGSLDDEVRASKVEREIDVLKVSTFVEALTDWRRRSNIPTLSACLMSSTRKSTLVLCSSLQEVSSHECVLVRADGITGGELFDHILASRYLKEKDAQKLFAQLISGVDYLHKKHIVHRDLKLENLLLDKHRNIIITDFGFANRFDHETDDLMATSCGSPCYAAPELVVSEGLYVGSAVDIWSCGVILYAMLSGYLPYDDDPANPDGDNINLLYKYIMSTKLNFPDHMSAAAKHLLQIMLVPNPEQRCRIEQIMEHPWLAGYRDIFSRSVEDHEYLFQESMYKKSQTAKRELAERRRVQIEGKNARQAVVRSQSSMPGTTVTAGMLDQHRRARENRHHSALPNTTTMPEFLNKAATQLPSTVPAPSRQSLPIAVPAIPQTSPVNAAAPLPAPPAILPTPPATAESKASPPRQMSESMGPKTSPAKDRRPSTALDSNEAVENEPMDVDAKEGASAAPRPPMSSNKNRHTIQVEYDGEASYERMKEILRAKREAAGGASLPVLPVPLSPALAEQSSPDKSAITSDVEMESGSEIGHTEEGTVESAIAVSEGTPAASQVLTPHMTPPATNILEVAPEEPVQVSTPSTPSKKGKEPIREVVSPSTPRASSREEPIEEVVTPRPKAKAPVLTPRSNGKRAESMPAKAAQASTPDQTTPVPKINPALKPSGLPQVPSPKRDRYRKGMSLDKFGLAKLLGQTSASSSTDVSRPPVSASAVASAKLQSQQTQTQQENGLFRSRSQKSKRQSMVRPRTAEPEAKEKKTRRRTLQLIRWVK